MNNTEYIKHYQVSSKFFLGLKLEIKTVFHSLNSYELNDALESKKVGIYWHLKKLIPCFDILFEVSKLNSTQSLITLLRMIVDNYAVLYLLTSFSSKHEQLLRYYLYLLDAASSRPKIINKFVSNIIHKIPDEAYEQANETIISDNKTSDDLIKIISKKKLDLNVNKAIIKNSNWKFKNKKENDKYNFIELYTIARIPKHQAELIQVYFSTFVHGLGLSLNFKDDEENSPYVIFSYDLCSDLMSMIIKIIMIEFDEETKNVKLHPKTLEIINEKWNDWK